MTNCIVYFTSTGFEPPSCGFFRRCRLSWKKVVTCGAYCVHKFTAAKNLNHQQSPISWRLHSATTRQALNTHTYAPPLIPAIELGQGQHAGMLPVMVLNLIANMLTTTSPKVGSNGINDEIVAHPKDLIYLASLCISRSRVVEVLNRSR